MKKSAKTPTALSASDLSNLHGNLTIRHDDLENRAPESAVDAQGRREFDRATSIISERRELLAALICHARAETADDAAAPPVSIP